ncbi:hypothetical protein C1H46_023590 [Malus baccata]|uniref:Uncharacterized protein n=1 Tax=Malus baccata TaxID=106549 RepID=A0A540LWK2_MALBA|nr:hypothetical protein C1H46_023590 [Malus baccata]
MASSSKKSKLVKVSPYNLPLTRVRNREEAICNLSHVAFRLLTCFELLNQWFEAKLDILKFRMLYNIRSSLDDHYYFAAKASLGWETYIQDIICHDKDGFKDKLVVDGAWERDISELWIQFLLQQTQFSKIGVYRPDLIRCPMQISAVYRNWKWLFFAECFNNRGKDIDTFHCSRFPISRNGLLLVMFIE